MVYIFQGDIVVSGGLDFNLRSLKTAESYDVIAGEWSSMPNMNRRRVGHSLVVVENKLFVISGRITYEVFDKTSNKFVSLKLPKISFHNRAISIGKKILVIHNNAQSIACYNVDKDEWSEESCEATKRYLDNISVFKIPQTYTDTYDSEKTAEVSQISETGNSESSDIVNSEQNPTIPVTETAEMQENPETESFDLPESSKAENIPEP